MLQQTAVEFLIERYKANGDKLTDEDFQIAINIEIEDQAAHFDAGVSEYDRLFGLNPRPDRFELD